MIALTAVLVAPRTSEAQSSASGIISGAVRDQTGAAVASVQVAASRADGSYERRDVTGADGTFRLAALPPGAYNVTARRIGYQVTTVQHVVVSAANVSSIEVRLEPLARALKPMVVNDENRPSGRQTEVSPTLVTASQISALPVELDLDRLIALAPGVRPDQMWGGAGVQANAYQLDGVSINHPGTGGAIVSPSIHWIEQLEVHGLGAGADQGGFQGGLVDIVTKSGSNTHQGNFTANYENSALDATNLSGTVLVPELDGRQEVAGETSGPIVQDKLFYFVAAQWIRTDEHALDHLGSAQFSPVHELANVPSGFAKLTWTPSISDLINAGIAVSDSTTDHAGLTGLQTADATYRVRNPSLIVDGSWQRTFGAQTILEAKFVGFSSAMHEDPYMGADVPGISTYQLETARSYQNAQFTVNQRPTSLGYTLTLDRFGHWFGDHHLRMGTEMVQGGWLDDETRTAGMTWRPRYSTIDGSASTFVPTDATTWQTQTPTAWGGETHLDAHVQNDALFLQDDIGYGRIGVHPGLRYGWWSGTIDPYGGGATIHALSTSGLDPRIGLTADLGTDRHPLSLTVHWGRYHQDLFAQMFDRVSGANAYSNYELWEYSGPKFQSPTTVITVAQRDSLAALGQFRQLEFDQLDQSGPVKNYHQPYVDQLVVGLQTSPDPHWRVAATFVARDNRDLVALVDKNLASDYVEADSVAVLDHLGNPVLNYNGAPLIMPKVYIPKNAIAEALADGLAVPGPLTQGQNLTYDPQYSITNVPQAKRRFRQLQFTTDARYADWQASASLSFTSLTGNFSTVSGYDPSSVTGHEQILGRGPGPYVRLNEQTDYDGDLDNSSRIELKLRAIRDLGAKFRGGIVASTVSGDRLTPAFILQPYTYSYSLAGVTGRAAGSSDPGALPAVLFIPLAGQSVNLAPLGSYHYAGHMTLDLHLERPVVTAGVEWTLTLDAFNVLGSKAVTLINTSVGADADPNSATQFASPLGRIQPRVFRLGTSAHW